MGKSKEMQAIVNHFAEQMFGWDGDESHCKTCNEQVCLDEFTDELSVREFNISGMCQKCQNDIFGG